MKPLLIVVVLVISGAIAAAERRSEKPGAPIALRLDAVAAPGGYLVTLTAVATRAVPAVELAVAGQRVAFGPTAAGQSREWVVKVASRPGDALDVIGSAAAAGRNRVASVHLGAAAAQHKPRRTVVRTLPDGREVAEAR